MWVINVSQKANEKYYRKKITKISDYTIHLKDMGIRHANIYNSISSIVDHFNTAVSKETNCEELSPIYDINYPIFTESLMNYYEKKTLLNIKLKNANKSLGSANNEIKQQQFDKKAQSYQNDLLKLNLKIEKERATGMSRVNDIFITFSHLKYAVAIKKAYSQAKCKRCCMICCCLGSRLKHL
jgi:hypothetical protein